MHSRPLRRASLAGLALATTVAIVLPVSADAPISGKDQQYSNFGPGDTLITDKFTGLIWLRPKTGVPYVEKPFVDAEKLCVSPSRLPTVKELLTLVDEDPHPQYVKTAYEPRYIDRRAFDGTPSKPFWTSSKFSATENFTVNFTTGTVTKTDTGDSRAVICVEQ